MANNVPNNCDHCLEHKRILNDHDKELENMRVAMEARREEILSLERRKLPNHLFYLFITVYSVLFIVGIVSVYKGMTQNTLMFSAGLEGIRINQTELKAKIDSVDNSVADLTTDVNALKPSVRSLH